MMGPPESWGRESHRVAAKNLLDLAPIPRMLKAGFTRAQIDMMMKSNPARLIGLEKW